MDLKICRLQSLNVVFLQFSVFDLDFGKKIENLKLRSKMAAASDVIMFLWLPWKPIKQQVVSTN